MHLRKTIPFFSFLPHQALLLFCLVWILVCGTYCGLV